jgi:hypothetical protein
MDFVQPLPLLLSKTVLPLLRNITLADCAPDGMLLV